MKFNIDWDAIEESVEILMEAPEDDGTGEGDLQATDYGDMEDVDVEEVEDLGAEDYTDNAEAEDNDVQPEEGGDTEGLDEEPVEGEEPMGEEGEENPEGTDETTTDEQEDNNTEELEKNEYLINDFIELYNRLNTMIVKIDNDINIKMTKNPLLIKAKDNVEKLKDVTYDYIIDRFNKESYLTNLYQFNLIIQAINVNMELLEKGVHINHEDCKSPKNKKVNNKR